MDGRLAPATQIISIETELDEKTQENVRLRRTLTQFRSTTEQLTKRYETLLVDSQRDRKALQTLQRDLTASTKANDDLTMRLSDLMTERDAAVRRAREIEEKMEKRHVGEEAGAEKVDPAEDERRPSASLVSEVQLLRRAVDSYQRELQSATSDVERLQQECNVSKKERQDALNEQESLTAQCYRVRKELDAVTSNRDDLAAKCTDFEATVARLELELERATRESREAQEKRNWAFDARSQVVRECNEARLACDELREARDRAVSNHMEALHELDGLKSDLTVARQEAKEASNERRVISKKVNGLIERLMEWTAIQDAPTLADDSFEDEVGGQRTGFDSGVGSSEHKEDVASDAVKVKICNVDSTEWDAESSSEKQRGKVSLPGSPFEWGITWETRLFAAEVQAGSTAAGVVEPGSCIVEINGQRTRNCSLDQIREAVASSSPTGGTASTLTIQKRPLKVPADIQRMIKDCKAVLTAQSSALRPSPSWMSLASGVYRSKSPATSTVGDLISKGGAEEHVKRKSSLGNASLTVSWTTVRSGRSLKEKEKDAAVAVGAIRQSLSPESEDSQSKAQRKRRSISTELRDEIRRSLNEARLLSTDVLLSPTSADFYASSSGVSASAFPDKKSSFYRDDCIDFVSADNGVVSPLRAPLFVANSKRSSIAVSSPLASHLGSVDEVPAKSEEVGKSDRLRWTEEERTVTLRKRNGTLGFLIKGGNATGIFVSEIRPGFSVGGVDGIQPGDEILMVGEHSLVGLTRQEAADILRSVVDSVAVVVRHNMMKFLQLPSSCDCFYVKCLRSYEGNRAIGEISFAKGDTLRVTDTVVNHPALSWHAVVVNSSASKSGAVPNMKRSLQDGEPLYERIDQPTFL